MSTDDTAQGYVNSLKDVGFDKVVVINASYQPAAQSSQDAAASAWQDADGVTVNENQSLADDWAKATSFSFFKKKYSVLQKSATHVVGVKGNDIIVAKQTGDDARKWIICHGKKKGMSVSKKAKKGDDGAAFSNPPDAYTKACAACFDEIDDE